MSNIVPAKYSTTRNRPKENRMRPTRTTFAALVVTVALTTIAGPALAATGGPEAVPSDPSVGAPYYPGPITNPPVNPTKAATEFKKVAPTVKVTGTVVDITVMNNGTLQANATVGGPTVYGSALLDPGATMVARLNTAVTPTTPATYTLTVSGFTPDYPTIMSTYHVAKPATPLAKQFTVRTGVITALSTKSPYVTYGYMRRSDGTYLVTALPAVNTNLTGNTRWVVTVHKNKVASVTLVKPVRAI